MTDLPELARRAGDTSRQKTAADQLTEAIENVQDAETLIGAILEAAAPGSPIWIKARAVEHHLMDALTNLGRT